MSTEQEALSLIAQYEQSEVVALVPVENGDAEWQASFADGHNVAFWTDDNHMLVENRVHIVERS